MSVGHGDDLERPSADASVDDAHPSARLIPRIARHSLADLAAVFGGTTPSGIRRVTVVATGDAAGLCAPLTGSASWRSLEGPVSSLVSAKFVRAVVQPFSVCAFPQRAAEGVTWGLFSKRLVIVADEEVYRGLGLVGKGLRGRCVGGKRVIEVPLSSDLYRGETEWVRRVEWCVGRLGTARYHLCCCDSVGASVQFMNPPNTAVLPADTSLWQGVAPCAFAARLPSYLVEETPARAHAREPPRKWKWKRPPSDRTGPGKRVRREALAELLGWTGVCAECVRSESTSALTDASLFPELLSTDGDGDARVAVCEGLFQGCQVVRVLRRCAEELSPGGWVAVEVVGEPGACGGWEVAGGGVSARCDYGGGVGHGCLFVLCRLQGDVKPARDCVRHRVARFLRAASVGAEPPPKRRRADDDAHFDVISAVFSADGDTMQL